MSKAIEIDPSLARKLTIKSSLCTIITDGTAILGLGNIGLRAGLPII